MNKFSDRRYFVKQATFLAAGLSMASSTNAESVKELGSTPALLTGDELQIPDNPLVLFDNFHTGNRHTYSWKAKFAAARQAGFDGFEFAVVDPDSDHWKEAMDLVRSYYAIPENQRRRLFELALAELRQTHPVLVIVRVPRVQPHRRPQRIDAV